MKLRGIVGIFFLVLCCAGVLVGHVYKQNTWVRLSMGTINIDKAKLRLLNEIALLEVEVGTLKKPSRMESIAKGRFGLEYGNTPILVYPEDKGIVEPHGPEVGKVAWRTKEF